MLLVMIPLVRTDMLQCSHPELLQAAASTPCVTVPAVFGHTALSHDVMIHILLSV